MFDRMANGIASLIGLAAVVFAVFRAVQAGFSVSYWAVAGIGIAMLLVGGWWLSRQAPGTPFREYAIPAAVATVVPFLLGAGSGGGLDILGGGYMLGWIPWTVAAAAAATGDGSLPLSEVLLQFGRYGLPMLWVEHDMQMVMDLADRIVVLDHGVKIADGVPEVVAEDPAVRAAYLGVGDTEKTGAGSPG